MKRFIERAGALVGSVMVIGVVGWFAVVVVTAATRPFR